MQVALPADPNHCPLCGQPNECAMEIERATGVKLSLIHISEPTRPY
mgnify:CR=1 FL=1